MKCNNCQVKKCETRELLKKYTDPRFISIIDQTCNEFVPKRRKNE